MSKKHPIIAVTGSSGAGTTNIKEAFEKIFNRQGINAAVIEGDSYHRYNREEMERLTRQAMREGRHITHFGPEGNLLEELEAGFREYAEHTARANSASISIMMRMPRATAGHPAH